VIQVDAHREISLAKSSICAVLTEKKDFTGDVLPMLACNAEGLVIDVNWRNCSPFLGNNTYEGLSLCYLCTYPDVSGDRRRVTELINRHRRSITVSITIRLRASASSWAKGSILPCRGTIKRMKPPKRECLRAGRSSFTSQGGTPKMYTRRAIS
jgi:hypothetical protein